MTWPLSLRGAFPLWLAVLLAVVVIVGVWMLYVRDAGRLPAWRRVVLAGLRGSALLWLIFLILKPVIVFDYRDEVTRPIALLLDNSQSMTQADPRLNGPDRLRAALAFNAVAPNFPISPMASLDDARGDFPEKPTRAEMLRAILVNPRLKLTDNLRKAGPVRYYLFGNRLRAIPEGKPEDVLKADESKTGLYDAAFELLKADEVDRPSAIVIASDGRDNASSVSLEELARECARLKIPLYPYGVGCSGIGTIQLKEVTMSDTLFVEDIAAVPVRWRCRGFSSGNIEIVVTLNGREVARKRLPVKEGEEFQETLTFSPLKSDAAAGRQELVTTISLAQGNERFTDESRRPVRIVDKKVKVLLIEGAPRWEFKFLQRVLLRDRRVELSCLLAEGDPRTLASGRPFLPKFPSTRQELFAFDLIVLGDVSAKFLEEENPDHIAWIRDFVSEGGGLVLLAGRNHAPAEYVNKPLAEILPVEFTAQQFPSDSGLRTQAFSPKLTPEGERSDLLALADTPDESKKIWRELPGIYWHYPVSKLKPGATALLVHPRLEADRKPMPLLATQYYGKGLVVFIAFEETWRWRYNEEDKHFARFWGQVVYLAGLPHTAGTKLAQLAVDRTESVLGRTGQVYAKLLTPEYRPFDSPRISARLERLDPALGEARSTPIVLEGIPGQPGEYTATIPHDRAGRFAVKLDSPEPAAVEYRVALPMDHELAPGSLAEPPLRRLAELTGGKFLREEDLHLLGNALRPQVAIVTRRSEFVLWNCFSLTVFLVLISAEWVFRKFSHLS